MLAINQDSEFKKPFIRFERVAVENKTKSLEAGHFVAVDVDYVNVTPPYSKDIFKQKVNIWLNQVEQDAINGRIPQEWVNDYKKAYEAFKNGQELPLNGFPIKGWGIISPAQQETLIRMHVLTVEQLAEINDEGIRRVGMGAIDLKNKAQSWLKTLKKSGGAALELAELRRENEDLKMNFSALSEKFEALSKMISNQPKAESSISMNELMSDDDESFITD